MILFVPRNPDHANLRHGGVRRECQIYELVASVGVPVRRVTLEVRRRPKRLERAFGTLRQSFDKAGFFPANRREFRIAAAALDADEAYTQMLATTPQAKLIVLENTRDHLMMIPAARRRGIGVICVPHDMESLTQLPFAHDQPFSELRRFWSEVRAIGQASQFFSISFEEQWLLRGFGIPAERLSYYPCTSDRTSLERIRAKRLRSSGNDILVLGTAAHPPTGRGMREVLDYLRKWPAPGDQTVTVAGFGTDVFKSYEGGSANIQVLGYVSDETLEQLLMSARAAVLNQWFGCGALTRVPELLLAGVPIIANPIAARSYQHLDGLYTYTTGEELTELLSRELPTPEPPCPPVAEEDRFILALRTYLGLTIDR